MSRGIDYGLGSVNIDKETGIRYGVISANDVPDWYDEAEPDYGDPHCPKCGGELAEFDDEVHDDFPPESAGSCADFACETCNHYVDSGRAQPDEPHGYVLDNGEYQASSDGDGDIFIVKSPYFTRAEFCSPCAPGACYLTNPDEDGERAYCFGIDWFEDGKAPYPVYSVATGELVFPGIQ
jgi:hypothetical protein